MIMIIWNEEEKQYENNERMFFFVAFHSLLHSPLYMWLLFSHLYDFDIIFKCIEIWNNTRRLLKVPTQTH